MTEPFKFSATLIEVTIGNLFFQLLSKDDGGEFFTFQKRMFKAKCDDCGTNAMVPFKPTPGKPIYCKTCYMKHRFGKHRKNSEESGFDEKLAWARRHDDFSGRKTEELISVFQHH